MGDKAINRFMDKVIDMARNERTDEQNRKTIEANYWSMVEMGNFKATSGTPPDRERQDQEQLLDLIYKEYLHERNT